MATIQGGTGSETLTGSGSGGEDVFVLAGGQDTIQGTGPNEAIDLSHATGPVTVDLSTQTSTTPGTVSGWGTAQTYDITQVVGSPFGGTITAGSDTNDIVATGGDTLINGSSSSMFIILGTGNDTVHANGGNDTIFVGQYAGQDGGQNNIDGGTGYTTVNYSNSPGHVGVDLYVGAWHDGIQDVLRNVDNIIGNNGGDTLLGNFADNILVGGTGADYIDGRDGNDTLTGGGGQDTFVMDSIVGRATITDFSTSTDTIDVSAFFSNFAQVTAATTQVGGNAVIQLGANGSVTLNNVQANTLTAGDFSFTHIAPPDDTSVGSGGATSGGGGGLNNTVAQVAADLNGDGHGDLFWQNTVNGLTSAWELNGTTASGVSLPNASGWQVDDTGNFSGGAYSGDMLLRNTTTGMVDIWSDTNGAMSGHDVASATLDWQIMGTADFNGDGKSDILWRNEQNGYVSVWQMNGSTVSTTYNPGVVGLQWHVIGAGDYVGDGKAEVLWRDSGTGEVNLWTIDGPGAGQTHGQTVATLGLEWQAVGQGDFNGDGRQDVLWHDNVTGQVVIWEMNGAQVLASQAIANLGAQWKVVDVVDANGDGKADIVWRDSNTGQTVLWDMNGFNVLSTHVLGTVDNTWQTINHHFDWI